MSRDGGSGYRTYVFEESTKRCAIDRKGRVTDLINRIVQVLKEDLYRVKISTRNTELIKPVKP